MSDETKVTISTGGTEVETTVGELRELADSLAGEYTLHTVLGEEVQVPREQIDALLERYPVLRRPGMRQVTKVVRKQGKGGERWGVTTAWATATEGGPPDEREETVWVNEVVSDGFRTAVKDMAFLAAKEAGLDEESVEVWLEKLVPGSVPEFDLLVRRVGEGAKGLAGAMKLSFALYPSKKLAEAVLNVEVKARRLLIGRERVTQGELEL